jgi:hypothetical protein
MTLMPRVTSSAISGVGERGQRQNRTVDRLRRYAETPGAASGRRAFVHSFVRSKYRTFVLFPGSVTRVIAPTSASASFHNLGGVRKFAMSDPRWPNGQQTVAFVPQTPVMLTSQGSGLRTCFEHAPEVPRSSLRDESRSRVARHSNGALVSSAAASARREPPYADAPAQQLTPAYDAAVQGRQEKCASERSSVRRTGAPMSRMRPAFASARNASYQSDVTT